MRPAVLDNEVDIAANALDRDIADDDHLDVVALFLHAEVFEPNRRRFPHAAADALNAEALSAQLFRAVDAGSSHEVEILTAAEARDDFQLLATHGSSESRRCAAVSDLRVARSQRRNLRRVAPHPNDFRLHSVFAEEVQALRNPQRNRSRAHARVRDDDLA